MMKKNSYFSITTLVVLMFSATWLFPAAPVTEYKKGRGMVLESMLPDDAKSLDIGDPAPDFSLLGVDGKTYSLSDFSSARILMVIFLSNHCPYSHAMEGRLIQLSERYKGDGFAVVAINPNNPDAVRMDELGYSEYSDSYEEMISYARENGFRFPYLYDGETQATAKAYGALATPHVFLFDQGRTLRYWGRFDDSRLPDPSTVSSPDAQNAVEALLKDQDVPVTLTRPMGCSTKWLNKREDVRAFEEKWRATPVELENIDAAGIRKLVQNETHRLRLINIWATWCAPCVGEFPGLVDLSQRFANREFEIVTISIDDPGKQDQVRKFLEANHVVPSNRLQRVLKNEGIQSTNFLYTGARLDELVAALDVNWPGPIPYTIVVRPGGEIVFRKLGELDFDELTRKLVMELGKYYSE